MYRSRSKDSINNIKNSMLGEKIHIHRLFVRFIQLNISWLELWSLVDEAQSNCQKALKKYYLFNLMLNSVFTLVTWPRCGPYKVGNMYFLHGSTILFHNIWVEKVININYIHISSIKMSLCYKKKLKIWVRYHHVLSLDVTSQPP